MEISLAVHSTGLHGESLCVYFSFGDAYMVRVRQGAVRPRYQLVYDSNKIQILQHMP